MLGRACLEQKHWSLCYVDEAFIAPLWDESVEC